MKYLTIKDITTVITSKVIDNLSEDDQTNFDYLESCAISLVEAKIGRIYNMKEEWIKSGYDRCQLILRIIKDIFVYDYFTQNRQDMMSELRQLRYDEALKQLDKINKGIDVPIELVARDPEFDQDATSGMIFNLGVNKINQIY